MNTPTRVKKIRFWDALDECFIYLDINKVKAVYDNGVLVGDGKYHLADYTDIDDFMQCHRIAEKHRKYILGGI